MTTNLYEFRVDGRVAEQAREALCGMPSRTSRPARPFAAR